MSKIWHFAAKSVGSGLAVALTVYVILELRLFATRPFAWTLLLDRRSVYLALVLGFIVLSIGFLNLVIFSRVGGDLNDDDLITATNPAEWPARLRGAGWFAAIMTVDIYVMLELLSFFTRPATWTPLSDLRTMTAALFSGLIALVAGFFRISRKDPDDWDH